MINDSAICQLLNSTEKSGLIDKQLLEEFDRAQADKAQRNIAGPQRPQRGANAVDNQSEHCSTNRNLSEVFNNSQKDILNLSEISLKENNHIDISINLNDAPSKASRSGEHEPRADRKIPEPSKQARDDNAPLTGSTLFNLRHFIQSNQESYPHMFTSTEKRQQGALVPMDEPRAESSLSRNQAEDPVADRQNKKPKRLNLQEQLTTIPEVGNEVSQTGQNSKASTNSNPAQSNNLPTHGEAEANFSTSAAQLFKKK